MNANHAVIVTLPADVPEGAQVCVRHEEWGVEVDVRKAPQHSWVPVGLVGGSYEVRP